MKVIRFVLFVLLVLMLTACNVQGVIQTSSAVQVPQVVQDFIGLIIFSAVMAGLQWIYEKLHIDFTGIAATVAGALDAFVVAQLQGWINVLPEAYDPYLMLIFKVFVVIIGGVGTLRVILHPQHVGNQMRFLAPKV